MLNVAAFLRRAGRNLPNAISAARLAATPVLLAAVLLRHAGFFTWLLFACLLSDILDGLIARGFHLTSKLGAALDSAADAATMLIAIVGVIVFERPFVHAHLAGILLVVILYCVEMIAAFLRYGRLSSFHTLFARIAAYAGGIFVQVLFFWGYQGWLFHIAVAAYAVSSIEELVLIGLLPTWQSDVGGVYRVLAAGKAKP